MLMYMLLVGDHFILVADEQSPRWVNCDVSRTNKTSAITVANVAKKLSISTEHGHCIVLIVSNMKNVIAIDT